MHKFSLPYALCKALLCAHAQIQVADSAQRSQLFWFSFVSCKKGQSLTNEHQNRSSPTFDLTASFHHDIVPECPWPSSSLVRLLRLNQVFASYGHGPLWFLAKTQLLHNSGPKILCIPTPFLWPCGHRGS